MPDTAESTIAETASTETQSAPPTTSLGQVWTDRMAARTKADEAKGAKPETVALETSISEKKTAETKAADASSGTKVKPLDAIIDGAKPAAKVETTDAEDIPLNAPAKTLRSAYEHQRAEAAKWKAEAEKAKAPNPEINGRLEAFEKERTEWQAERAKYKDALAALDVTYDPEHQAKFVDGRAAIVSKAADKLNTFGGDGKALAEALALPDGKARNAAVKEAVAELDEFDRAKVAALIEKVDALDEEAAEIRRDPKQAWEKMTKAQQERQQAQAQEVNARKTVEFDRVAKSLPEKFFLARTVGDDVQGASEHNAKVSASMDAARHLLSDKATFGEVAAAAQKASFADWLQEEFVSERTARIAAEKELASFRKAEPGFRGTGQAPASDKMAKTPGQIWREGMARRNGAKV